MSPTYQVGFAQLLQNIDILHGQNVLIRWQISHVRPETLLRLPLNQVSKNHALPGVYEAVPDPEHSDVVRYALPEQAGDASGPRAILELSFSNEKEALAALRTGEIDAWDRVPPWQVERLRQANDVVVDNYRMPTVHVLIPNHSKPLLGRREFRRARRIR